MLKDFKAVPPFVTGHRPLSGRPLPLCLLLGCRRVHPVRRERSLQAQEDRLRCIWGGIVRRAAHPSKPKQSLNGGPQMVEVSRDGKRIYFTNSLYSTIDDQFYPDGMRSWMVKVNAKPEGGIEVDPALFPGVQRVAQPSESAWRAVTPPRTPTATHERGGVAGLARLVPAGRLPRRQSGHGLAVRRRSRDAGGEPPGCGPVVAPHCSGLRCGDRSGGAARRAGPAGRPASVCFRPVSPLARPASPGGAECR